MARVSGADLGRVLHFVHHASLGTPAAPIAPSALISLRDLLGASEAESFEFRVSNGDLVGLTRSDDFHPVRGTEEALRAFGWQNPLGWRRWYPAHGAVRLTATMRPPALRRLEFYQDFMRPNGMTDLLKVWLSRSHESVACIHLWRRGPGSSFGQREQDRLDVLQHHLIELRRAGVAGRVPRTSDGVELTVREATILSWVARGCTDREIAAILMISPATVGKHLERAFVKLEVTSRSEVMWRLTAHTGDGVRPEPHEPRRTDA